MVSKQWANTLASRGGQLISFKAKHSNLLCFSAVCTVDDILTGREINSGSF